MNIYLAARYSRRLELCEYREQLRAIGHSVDAVWLNGAHQVSDIGTPLGDTGEALVEGDVKGTVVWEPVAREQFYHSPEDAAAKLRQKFAADDFRDVLLCDMLIHFTEMPRSKPNRGGRHVEFGIALGLMKRVWIVGPHENLFCWMEGVRQFDHWYECYAALIAEKMQ